MMRWLISLAVLICACSPIIELARLPFTSEGAPLAVDATNVYSGAGGVFAVPIAGGDPVLVGYPRPEGDLTLPRITAIAVDDQFVYSTSQFGMWRFSPCRSPEAPRYSSGTRAQRVTSLCHASQLSQSMTNSSIRLRNLECGAFRKTGPCRQCDWFRIPHV